MGFQQRIAVRSQLQLSQPQGNLIGTEAIATGELHIQQPILQMRRLGTFTVEQKLLFRLLAQQAVFHAKLIVSQLDFLDIRQLQRLEISAKLQARVIPEHYALLVEQVAQGLGYFCIAHAPFTPCSTCPNRCATVLQNSPSLLSASRAR